MADSYTHLLLAILLMSPCSDSSGYTADRAWAASASTPGTDSDQAASGPAARTVGEQSENVSLDWETLIALASAIVSVAALFSSLVVRHHEHRHSQISAVFRIHELWWKPDMDDLRQRVVGYVEDWESKADNGRLIIESYRNRDPAFEEARREIGRIAYFFSDLEAVIDAGLASERFAYRLFGESQFFCFSGFLLAAAEASDSWQANTAPDEHGRSWRWGREIRALDQRFRRIQASRRSKAMGGEEVTKNVKPGPETRGLRIALSVAMSWAHAHLWLLLAVVSIGLTLLAPLAVFTNRFREGGISNDPEAWATFATFVSGTTGVLIALTNAALVYYLAVLARRWKGAEDKRRQVVDAHREWNSFEMYR